MVGLYCVGYPCICVSVMEAVLQTSLIFTLLLLISVSCSFVLVELGDQLVLSLTIGLLLYNVSALTVLDWLPSWVIINYYFP